MKIILLFSFILINSSFSQEVKLNKDQKETYVRINYALSEKNRINQLMVINIQKAMYLNGRMLLKKSDYTIHKKYTTFNELGKTLILGSSYIKGHFVSQALELSKNGLISRPS